MMAILINTLTNCSLTNYSLRKKKLKQKKDLRNSFFFLIIFNFDTKILQKVVDFRFFLTMMRIRIRILPNDADPDPKHC